MGSPQLGVRVEKRLVPGPCASADVADRAASEGPLQLFHPDIANQLKRFPAGMIPSFLLPHAIFFHLFVAVELQGCCRPMR